ncbi:unnamed protein product [Rotaria sordida]|uniref:Uncharacterized protein n=1 Tax=Rotaria sordida TaxID=392033 RepID=A0A814CJ47_9BILA|nr:unnamed protein product [Rotaria sordida]CAF0954865.1 unnamed protein product [Rotaria sordida]CAF3852524.1 unnamed protein product [Rotaria sordida]CAF3929987.1 unnamed protein product [Rotaria sordida]
MEATDMARHQQISLAIRYVDDEFNVYECFTDFGRASDTTDEMDIAEAVVHVRDSSDAVKCLYNLTEASTKCHKMFEDLQKKVGVVSVPLKQSFDTRWICRYENEFNRIWNKSMEICMANNIDERIGKCKRKVILRFEADNISSESTI